uniref:Aldehyde dehydrogenase 3 family, member A1 n=1 Tax=Sinocyclocheilus rhinocerous TaxID=307959 RepID=A0A673IDC5_9TELE
VQMEKQVVDGLREVFQSRSRPLQYRKQQHRALHRLITERQADIEQALKQDLNRVRIENDIKLAESDMADWAAPRPVKKNLNTALDDVYIKPEPLGVFIKKHHQHQMRFQLHTVFHFCCLGNAAVLKPSELSEHSARLMKELLPLYLDKVSPDYCRIINTRHFDRALALMNECTIALGGESDRSKCYIAPTVLKDVLPHFKIMQEEIFGPLLPMVTVNGLSEAINFINAREKPLALYVFSSDKMVIKRMLTETSSGGVTVNDVLMHYTVDTLPFGGVGNSGMGRYHGRHTFDQLSHHRACLVKSFAMESLNDARYPPLTAARLSMHAMSSRGQSAFTASVFQ